VHFFSASGGGSGGGDSSAYFIAFIAVVGTVVGASIAAITQVITARRSSRDQVSFLKLQLEHGSNEKLRDARRESYAAFLLAESQWERLAFEVYALPRRKRKRFDCSAQHRQYSSAHARLDLLAGEQVATMAMRVFNQDMTTMNDALNGDDPDGLPPGSVFPTALVRAMQDELGIKDVIPIDPETGLRVWPYKDVPDDE
jgi:hypothetical protein